MTSRDDQGARPGSAPGTAPAGPTPAAARPETSSGGPPPTGAAAGAGLLPALSLPQGGGAVRSIGEKFSTNPATGTVSLSIPVATSSGRSGVELSLELAYDSGAGNGPFGVGWGLSTPSVTRKTDKGLPRYVDAAESDGFLLSGAEDLVPVRVPEGAGTRLDAFDRTVGGQTYRVQRYRPRVEGLFARIERWTHTNTGDIHWRATTRDNVTNLYGQTPSARIADPEDARRVFSWLLEETRDDRGNIARYSYKAEDGALVGAGKLSEASRFDVAADGTRRFCATAQRYLKRIEYGNLRPGDPSDWLFEVVFDYGEHDDATPTPDEARPWPVRLDAFSSYRAGFEVRTYRLCRRALMFHRFAELGATPCLVRSTDFSYEEGPVLTYLTAATQAGYQRDTATGTYERAELPPLELGYIRPELHHEVHSLDRDSLEGMAGGVGKGGSRWVDLDGEGLPGVLATTPRAWFYKANLGGGRLAAPALLPSLPASAELAGGVQQLSDLAGDGRIDLVQYAPPLQGFFTRTQDGDWQAFTAFLQLPNIDWGDPNLRFVDLDGDGHPDVLITEHEVFTWYRSRAAMHPNAGFEPAARVRKPRDERDGAAVVFADGTETVHLADLSGDGLMDLVRVRSGEVCYWPNLGYARFGRKITLGNSPRFDAPDQFDPRRVRFADIDGSGTSDIVYLGREGAAIYLNQSGNALSDATLVRSLPPADGLSVIDVVDLLGQGTACLVWSSPRSAESARPVLYVDLMSGKKPHLLDWVKNNLGAETRIAYKPSTRDYLRDKSEGRPWLTRLPFPVQVIDRVERVDRIARSRLVTRFRYHHGFFDGHEREFRGFACVEQWDAESLGDRAEGPFPDLPPDLPHDVAPADADLNLPPVRTVTWFHTGAWLERERLELALAKEYYDQDPQAPLLRDTVLPAGLSALEEREAARALRGRVLRQEIYAEDGSPQSLHPYSVSERNYETRLLQHADGETPAVFFAHPRETVALHYERDPADPRTQHELVLEVDDFGNVTRSAAIAYPRRSPVEPEQGRLWVTVTDRSFANRPSETAWYRVGVPIETTTRELTGLTAPASGLLSGAEVRAAMDAASVIPYEAAADGTSFETRIIERERALYTRDDLSGALPLGQIDSLALPYETYRLALTPGLLAQVYGSRVDATMLESEGGYVLEDGAWWAPSGRVEHDAARFYLPARAIDPFGHAHTVDYDAYTLLLTKATDPLGNVTTAQSDYRVLAPALVTDPNGNRTAAAFDALGRVIKTAVMGKAGAGEGDTLADPTTRIEYALDPFRLHGKPAFVHTFAREQHGPANPRWQESYSYSDGSGREVMKKVQAEPGPVPVLDAAGHLVRNPDGSPQTRHADRRWIGTGRTVFDNKGNPVKKYEPFFSDTSGYEDENELVEWGVTPVLRYDPLGRLVRTELPNGARTKVVFDAWRQESWDPNDTVAGTPWLAAKQAGTPAEKRAASRALAHASTPSVSHLDSLGREFLAVADNGALGPYETRIALDVEGNQRSVTDARGVRVLATTFDMLGRPASADSADAGQRTTLLDVANKPARTWTPRGHAARHVYDALQRQTHVFVREGTAAEKLVERTVYGEAHPQAVERNLRGRGYALFDGAGVVTNARYDFKGNIIESARRLALEYRATPDWSPLASLTGVADIELAAEPLLEAEIFTTTTAYDALGRVVSRTTPDGSVTRPGYNEANLLETVEVRLRGAASWTSFIAHIDYNARGQRTRLQRGNGATTTYEYDDETFRLVRQRTTRASDGAVLQDLAYTHDPVGNVVQVTDAVSFGNQAVSAHGLYEYDALYQLTKAEGREHPGQQPTDADPALLRVDHPHDMQGLRRYRQQYDYDEVGNILRMAHQPLGPGGLGWTRGYEYAADSNRLLRTSAPGDPPGTLAATYQHDDAGNMTRMPHLPWMGWDYADRLQATSKQVVTSGTPETTYYTYDAAGQRVRKVTERHAAAGATPTRKSERMYLGGWEVFRAYETDGTTAKLVRETLHVMDDDRHVALVETKTEDTGTAVFVPTTRLRFQFDNHLGSSTMELDEDGDVITYEEYFPYGSTSFHAAHSATEVSAKRYRYTGKERDEETGLYYYGARYYSAWLGRWTAADPAGAVEGPNRYRFVLNNPIVRADPCGLQSEERVVSSDDPNDPHNYVSFEDFQRGAVGPWSADGLRQAWVEAHPTGSEQLHGLPQSDASATSSGTELKRRLRGESGNTTDEETRLWAEADSADYDSATTNALLDYYGEHGGLFERNTYLNRATVFATSGSRAFERGGILDIVSGVWDYTWASVDSFGYMLFGDTPAETTGNLVKAMILGAVFDRLLGASRAASTASLTSRRGAVLQRVLTSEGKLNTSVVVTDQLSGDRGFIPTLSILDTIATGTRRFDPQGVAGQYMYTAQASYNGSVGTLEVLVYEPSGQIRHVLFRSAK